MNANTPEHRALVRRNAEAAFVRRMIHLIRSGQWSKGAVSK